MARSKKVKSNGKPPLSGNNIFDLIFKVLLEILEKEIAAINVKRILMDPDDKTEELCGLIQEGEIYLGKRKHKLTSSSITSTLIHELLHQALPKLREKRIKQFEKCLWPNLTDTQKRYLRQYIPKHEVKKEPE